MLAAVALPGAAAHAQHLPQGYTSDISATLPEAPPPDGDAKAQGLAADDEYADTDPSALVEFHQPLAEHGTWIDDPTYGTVWVPAPEAVGPDFAPYVSGGHWALTQDGEWLWVSDYAWGYIPFHYGRWIWIPAYGWSWIPGRVYAPAWVVWRTGDHGYIGWAPMPPAFYWSSGVAVSFWGVPTAAYVFCPTTYVFHEHVTTYVVHDHVTVYRAAANTRPYRPARPGGSRAQGAYSGGSPSGAGSARSNYRPASPSLAEAGVSASAAPKSRLTADPRAIAYSRKSTTARARVMSPGARGLQRAPLPSSSARAQGATPQRPDAGDGRSAGHLDRSGSTPRKPSPVLRTPDSRGGAAWPTASPTAPPSRVTRTPDPRGGAAQQPASTPRPPSTQYVAPSPRAQSSTPRSSTPRSIGVPQAPAAPSPRAQSSTPRSSTPRSIGVSQAPSASRPSSPSGSVHHASPAPKRSEPRSQKK